MQPSSCMQEVPLPKNLRRGQKETAELFYKKSTVVTKLPTGYGKTKTAVCAYAILRENGVANRILYVVPRGNQATQAADSVPKTLRDDFGIITNAFEVVKDPIPAMTANRENTAEVFVTTIQGLSTSPQTRRTVSQLMETGRWFIVVDENHHYAGLDNAKDEQGAWTQAIKSLRGEAMLIMSATPARTDGNDHFPNPDVTVSYYDALVEGSVKSMHLHEYEYQVDMVCDGEVESFTTGDLFDKVGSASPEAIDKMIAKRKMRWSPKYISPLILNPAERMAKLRSTGVKSQMIVQAMSCTHAEMVCAQVHALLPTLNVDWVGTGPYGRTDKDNARIIGEFCPEEDKDGVRNWTLDVLVQVGMAGEGLDTKDCTEVVVLTRAEINTSLLQLFGRAARTMILQEGKPQPRAHINVDTDSGISKEDKYLGRRVMAIFDEEVEPDDIDEPGEAKEPTEDQPLDEELNVIVTNVQLVDIRKDPDYEPTVQAMQELDTRWTEVEIEDKIKELLTRRNAERDETFNMSSKIAMAKTQINGVTSGTIGLVLKRMGQMGMRPEKSLAGDLNKRINRRKKSHVGASVKDASLDQLKDQYKFLAQLYNEILTKHGLEGVPSWLR